MRGVKAAREHRDLAEMPPTPTKVDNAGVLFSMLDGDTMKSAYKHIFRTLVENRERVHLDKTVKAVKIDTKLNLANPMTKQEHGIAGSVAQLIQIAGPTLLPTERISQGVVLGGRHYTSPQSLTLNDD